MSGEDYFLEEEIRLCGDVDKYFQFSCHQWYPVSEFSKKNKHLCKKCFYRRESQKRRSSIDEKRIKEEKEKSLEENEKPSEEIITQVVKKQRIEPPNYTLFYARLMEKIILDDTEMDLLNGS